MFSLEVVAIFLSGISISVSLFYYANVLANANKTRQTQLFMQLYDKFVTKEFQEYFRTMIHLYEWTDTDDYIAKYSIVNNFEDSVVTSTVFHYFEGIGVLVEEGLIDSKLVAKLLAASVIQLWEKYESMILERRERSNRPRIYDKTEYLYHEIKKLRGQDWDYRNT